MTPSFMRNLLTLFFFALLALLSVSPTAAQNNSFKIYTTRDGLAGNYITALAFEPNGSAWVGTSEGATHLSDAGWVSYTRAHGLGDSWITAIAIAPDGKIWFGSQSGGVSVLDPISKTLTTYNLDNSNVPSNFIAALAIDSENRVWVGTLDKGIARYDVAQNEWTRFEFPEREITALAFDSENRLWAGTANGVYRFDGAEWFQDQNVGGARVKRLDAYDGEWYLSTDDARYILQNDKWVANDGADALAAALRAANLQDRQLGAFGKDYQARFWLGTSRGIFMVHPGNAPNPPPPYPTVLVHGWTVADDDTLETSEFRFLKSYADRDGIPMYYARGVSPQNTLFQNAERLRSEIARVKQETGADKVNLVGFSMGGMNVRAYLESSLYANDVNRAIILGTPQAGVDLWKPILFQQLLQKPDEPSTIELSPEYAQQIVNPTRAPNPNVPYDLLIGDARRQTGLDFLNDMPASDALISAYSSLALDGANVRRHVNADLHDWEPEPVPLDLTSYLYPRATWERYLRNALRNNDNAPIGSEIAEPPLPQTETPQSNHTPVVTTRIGAGETVTRTALLDENKAARFIAYYPHGKIDFSLVAPNGKKYEPSALPRAENGVMALATDIANFSGYVVQNAPPGEWKMILSRTDNGNQPLSVSTYVELNSPRAIQIGATPQASDAMVPFIAAPTDDAQISVRVGIPSQPAKPYQLVPVQVTGPDEAGRFYPALPRATPGWYAAFVTVRGKDFERETEFLYAAPADTIAFQAGLPLTIEKNADAPNQIVPARIGVEVKRAGNFALAAEIRDANAAVVARSFTPVALEQGSQYIPFSLRVPDPRAQYALRLTLYDTNWAALPGASLETNVKFQHTK